MAELESRLAAFQATAVPMSFHELNGTGCSDPDPANHPEWNVSWMPFCTGVAATDAKPQPPERSKWRGRQRRERP